jgi:hypothetical protein
MSYGTYLNVFCTHFLGWFRCVDFFAVFRIRSHFFRIRILIQRLRLETNTDPDPDPIRIQGFNDQKLKKNNS